MAGKSRVEESKEVVKIAPPPSYLQKLAADDRSTAQLHAYRVLQRVTVLQALGDPDLKRAYGEGVTLLMPDKKPVAKLGEPFLFVPLFFFPEFVTWRDRNDKSDSAVVARSYDPTSPIARKAKNKETRRETYPGGAPDKPFQYRHVEHLTFAGLVLKGGASGEVEENSPCALAFSRGEHFNGQRFIGEIMKRRLGPGMPPAPLWSQVWSMVVAEHDNPKGQRWWGFDYSVDPSRPWASEEEGPKFQALHLQLAADHERNRLVVDQTGAADDIDDEPASTAGDGGGKF